jgi:hypothetical protein
VWAVTVYVTSRTTASVTVHERHPVLLYALIGCEMASRLKFKRRK